MGGFWFWEPAERAPGKPGSSDLLLRSGRLSLGAKPGEPAAKHVLQFVVEDLRTRLYFGGHWILGELAGLPVSGAEQGRVLPHRGQSRLIYVLPTSL